MLIVMTTVADAAAGGKLAEKIVGAKLAACVQILPEMRSVYYWEGRIQIEAEHLLLIKTLDENYAELEVFIRSNHPYEVPEITAIAAEKVSESYLGWISKYLRP